MAAVLILLLAAPLLLSGSSYAVTLAWDANSEEDLAGYRIYWGTDSRVYQFVEDVGNTLQTTLDIPTGSYIAATAYDTDGNESAYSDEILYAQNSIQPTTGGQIYTVEIVASGMKLGVDYEMQELPDGSILYIYYNLSPGQRVRLEY